MASQRQQQRTTTSSLSDQLRDMISEWHDTPENVQSGTFATSSHPTTPPILFGPPSRSSATNIITGVSTPSRPPLPMPSSVSRGQIPVVTPDNDDDNQSTTRKKYRPQTLDQHNIDRLSILPMFPPVAVTIIKARVTTTAAAAAAAAPSEAPLIMPSKAIYPILSNVPIELLSNEQYARIRCNAFPHLFRLEMNVNTTAAATTTNNPDTAQPGSSDSFLLGLYQELYVKMKKRLKIDIPVIDFNLTRLQDCINRMFLKQDGRVIEQTMLNTNELVIALEFYLQIDVDMFFLKTCSFNGAQPRRFDQRIREGLFCLETPQARFAITPCQKQHCRCCRPTSAGRLTAVEFSSPHIYHFVNQYKAILNCPATCETKNFIYVLRCLCGNYDFIGESKLSFAEILALHREEGNRIMREFLIGEVNVQQITHGLKSEQKKANDKLWLYQHSPRCHVAMQHFLDYNPDYWCFAPMKSIDANMSRSRLSETTTRTTTTTDYQTSLPSWARTDREVQFLIENLPKPPFGYDFAYYQRQQQVNFFKWAKDRIVPTDNVDLYLADMIAILPDNSSTLLRKLIESLLITHAECQLNETGHLIGTKSDPNQALRNVWCKELTRFPFPT